MQTRPLRSSKRLKARGGKAIAIQADAVDAEAVKGAVEKTVAAFGGIDVLVNNAGTAIPKRFEETTLEELDRLFNINVRGTLVATQSALKHMKSGGRIIMIGSCVGERCHDARLGALLGHQGSRQDVHSGVVQRGGEPGITVNNVQPVRSTPI